jgi:hypothetical protein
MITELFLKIKTILFQNKFWSQCFFKTLLMFSLLTIFLCADLLIKQGISQEPEERMDGKMTDILSLDISDATQWTAHTDWLNNPSDEYEVRKQENILDFSVQEAGRGMKWSLNFPKPIDLNKKSYLVIDYRAEGISASSDYFIYMNVRIGDSNKELYTIMPGDLEGDGRWRKVIAEVPSAYLNWIAIQVQAKTMSAHIQIKSISFTSEKPEFSISDFLDINYNWDSNQFDIVDISPYCNADVNEKLKQMGLKSQWFNSERVTTDGIPFQVTLTPSNIISTKINSVETFTIPIHHKAGELYLLLGAYFEGNEEPSIGFGKLTRITHVERFVTEIVYEDGISDFVFPSRVGSERYVIENTMGVYRVIPTRNVDIKEIKIHDRMRQGEFYLAGLTISKQSLIEPKAEKPIQIIQSEGKSIIKPDVMISFDNHIITLNNGYLKATLNTEDGLIFTSLENGYTNIECLANASPIFAVTLGNELVSSSDFQVKEVSIQAGKVAEVSLVHDFVSAHLTLSFDDDNQLKFALKLTNTSDSQIKTTPSFLILENIFISSSKVTSTQYDQWYCFPRRGAVISNVPTSLNEPYSGSFPMQFMDVYHQQLGGIYVMKHDLSDEYKWFKLKKDKVISLRIDYMEKELKSGESFILPEVVIGTHSGDWHDALMAYRHWMKSWYKPLVERKQWFMEIFNFRQQFMHFDLPRKSGIFDNDTKEYHFRKTMEKDISDFGGVDYLHIFDWGWSKEYGRCGDYDHWEQIGGVESFRKAIAEVQSMGIPVGLYIEGYLVDPESNIGKAHGTEWQLLDQDGKPYSFFAPSYNICSAVKDWQEYLSQTYARVWRETGVNGFYVDEMGFADPGHFCYNPNHGHSIPESPLRGQRDLVRRIRESLPKDVVVYTEESPTDVNSQYQDGSFTYAISSVSDELSPTHLNLYRFAFPNFKTFEIITCDRPLGSDYQSVKRIFFNGEGIWIEGIADDWFTPETRAFIAKMNHVIKAHVKAFTSMNPIPLVHTLIEGIYANEFPTEKEIVWTIYNTNYSTVRGEIMAIPHKDGASYYDAWNEKELNPRIHQSKAYFDIEIGPKDIGCIIQRHERKKN